MSEKARRYYQEYLDKGFSIEDSKALAEAKEKKEEENKNKPKFFHEFWENEDELWELSMQESFRQRDERLQRKDNDV
jgi:DNA-binding transcriptional MerR regulator